MYAIKVNLTFFYLCHYMLLLALLLIKQRSVQYDICTGSETKNIKNTVSYFVISDCSASCIVIKRRSNPTLDYLHSIRGHLFANCSGPVYSTCMGRLSSRVARKLVAKQSVRKKRNKAEWKEIKHGRNTCERIFIQSTVWNTTFANWSIKAESKKEAKFCPLYVFFLP